MLEARHLVKRFFGTAVVNDVSFEVRAGEVVGYLGPNGSGKSTTAKMLTGLLETSSGVVFFDGQDIAHDPVAFHRRLGYVPEEPQSLHLSVGDRIPRAGRTAPRAAAGAPRAKNRRAARAVRPVALPPIRTSASYSKGMKQKVMIIAALLHDPDVLILDEPDSGLDVTATLVLRQLVIALARRGKAVLYSSHVLELVEKACDRVIVIHRGNVVADDTVDALQRLMSRGSFEDVFSQLVLRDDPERRQPTSPTWSSTMRDRLLVRHFLWRFLEHDLISPNADRHVVLSALGGTLVAVSLFMAVLIAMPYQFFPAHASRDRVA